MWAVGQTSGGAGAGVEEPGDGNKHLFPQSAEDCDLGQLEGDRARMANRLRANLDQPLAQAGQRPVRDLGWQSQGAQEIAEVIGECVEPEANGVGGECPARQARPADGVLPVLDPLLGYGCTGSTRQRVGRPAAATR